MQEQHVSASSIGQHTAIKPMQPYRIDSKCEQFITCVALGFESSANDGNGMHIIYTGDYNSNDELDTDPVPITATGLKGRMIEVNHQYDKSEKFLVLTQSYLKNFVFHDEYEYNTSTEPSLISSNPYPMSLPVYNTDIQVCSPIMNMNEIEVLVQYSTVLI